MEIINEKKHPYLKYLSDGIIKQIGITEEFISHPPESEVNKMYKFWKNNKFGEEEILMITKPFNEAVKASIKKLSPVIAEEINNTDEDIIGTMNFGDFWFSYRLGFRKGKENYDREVYLINNTGQFMAYLILTPDVQIYRVDTDIFTNAIQIREWFWKIESTIIANLIFRKYAEVETKIIIPTNNKPKTGEYFNKTRCLFTILDSKWFTNLIRTEGFKVRGHFRLQPYKDEKKEWTKKLIWIEDFKKNGYTHKAKITEYNNQ